MKISLDNLTRMTRNGEDNSGVAAQALESFFLRQVLSEVKGDESGLDGGFAGSTFREMLDGALADSMASGGGVGIAKLVQGQLERATGGSGMQITTPPLNAPAPVSAGPSRARSAYQSTPGTLTQAPVAGEESSPFGTRVDPIEGDRRYHAGLDLAAPTGTEVRAAGPGVVVKAGRSGGYGKMVVVDHGSGVETRYGHLSEMTVKIGDKLEAGGEVGRVGATGRATGPHLHFEVRHDGHAVDPTSEISALKFSR